MMMTAADDALLAAVLRRFLGDQYAWVRHDGEDLQIDGEVGLSADEAAAVTRAREAAQAAHRAEVRTDVIGWAKAGELRRVKGRPWWVSTDPTKGSHGVSQAHVEAVNAMTFNDELVIEPAPGFPNGWHGTYRLKE